MLGKRNQKMKQLLLYTVTFFYFLLFTNHSMGQIDSLWTAEQLSNMTVLLSQTNSIGSFSGTGTIINHNKKFYLITASHVSTLQITN